jgi:glutamate:GABA antiporter
VAEVTAGELVYETTASAVQEKKKLRRHFGRFDMFFFLICTVVTLDTVGAVAANGAQGFTWLIFLGIFFLLPYALSIAELGSAFPQEGGPYVWTRLAFGRPLAAVNSVIYWISNPIWVGGTLTIVSFAAAQEFFGFDGGDWKYVYALAFIWFVIGAAIVSLQYGKWVPTAGAWARGVLLVFFAVTVIAYAAKNGVHGFGGHEFLPTYALFVAVVPVLIFNYAGMEVPSAASEEMTNPQRDVPFSVLWSGTATMFAYAIPILLILIVLPVSQVTGLTGFLDAIKATFTVYGGHVASDGTATLTGAGLILGRIVAVVFIFALAAAGTTWIMGSDRTEAIASVDGGGPRILGRFSSRFGTPAVMNVVSGVVATILMVAAFQITGGNSSRYFEAVLGLTISTTTVSYLFIFPALAKLRYSRPDVKRPYRVPGGMAGVWICTILPTLWALIATVFLLWPGLGVNWFGAGGNPNDSLANLSFSGERLEYELSQFVPLAIVVLIGVVFYFLGGGTRRDEVEEPIAPALSPAGALVGTPAGDGVPAAGGGSGAGAGAGPEASDDVGARAGDSAGGGDSAPAGESP